MERANRTDGLINGATMFVLRETAALYFRLNARFSLAGCADHISPKCSVLNANAPRPPRRVASMKDLCDRVQSCLSTPSPFFTLSVLVLRSGNYRLLVSENVPVKIPRPCQTYLETGQQNGGQRDEGNGLARSVVSPDRTTPTTRFPSFCFLKYSDD